MRRRSTRIRSRSSGGAAEDPFDSKPYRACALAKFLDAMGADWSITLFHYRNHGADYGRILAGMRVPPADRARFTDRLRALGYPFEDETSNPAYRMFLGG